MARQLTFDLRIPPALSRADFLVAEANRLAATVLDAPEGWPDGRMLLTGPAGSGKTHLAAIWATERGAPMTQADQLRPDDADALVAPGGALVIEDAQWAAGLTRAEAALFHIWNLSAGRGCLLLMTAETPPRDWGLVLPDLQSRMLAMPQTRLGQPDEPLLAAVLVKLFADRQLSPPAGLIDWLVPRMDRSLGLARALVAGLDAAAMSRQGPVTRAMAAELLDKLTPLDA